MKVSLAGLIHQSTSILDRSKSRFSSGYASELRQLHKNLQELAQRHRKGDTLAIEEFIALYDLEPTDASKEGAV